MGGGYTSPPPRTGAFRTTRTARNWYKCLIRGAPGARHYNALSPESLASPGEQKEPEMTTAEVIEMPKTLDAEPTPQRSDGLTITDNRTGRVYELPIANGTIRAMDLRQIKTGSEDFGLMA